MGEPLRIAPRENKRSLALAWVLALVWAGFSAALVYLVFVQRDAADTPLWVSILVVVMALIGLLLVWALVHRTIGMAKYGGIELQLLAPPAIGGRLAARMTIPSAARGAAVLAAELACLHVRWQKTNDGESSNRVENELHRERREFPIQWAGNEGQVHLQFAIPVGLPHSDAEENDDEDDDSPAKGFHHWQVEVRVDTAGVDLVRSYPVRVAQAAT